MKQFKHIGFYMHFYFYFFTLSFAKGGDEIYIYRHANGLLKVSLKLNMLFDLQMQHMITFWEVILNMLFTWGWRHLIFGINTTKRAYASSTMVSKLVFFQFIFLLNFLCRKVQPFYQQFPDLSKCWCVWLF